MDEKKRDSAEVAEVAEDEEPVVHPDPDLEPEGLKKAYRFALWSSVALVRLVSKTYNWSLADAPLSPDGRPSYPHPVHLVRYKHYLRRRRPHRLGRHRHHLVLHFLILCSFLSPLGEPRSHCGDYPWDSKGALIFLRREQ